MSKSHYEVLGVLPSASQDEIRVAYRMRAREVHPDTAAGRRNDASIQMAHIAEAWRVLCSIFETDSEPSAKKRSLKL
jgi:DnaJ-class molecular chaperone